MRKCLYPEKLSEIAPVAELNQRRFKSASSAYLAIRGLADLPADRRVAEHLVKAQNSERYPRRIKANVVLHLAPTYSSQVWGSSWAGGA